MYSKIRRSRGMLLALVPALSVAIPQQVLAQDEGIEEIITTGTRSKARSVDDSPAPVDVLSGDVLREPGRHRPPEPAAHHRAVLQRQHAADQRRRDGGPAGEPARPGTRPHAGADQRQAPPSRRGHLLDRQRRRERRAGPRHFRRSRRSRCSRSKSCATAPRRSTAPTRSPACSTSSSRNDTDGLESRASAASTAKATATPTWSPPTSACR